MQLLVYTTTYVYNYECMQLLAHTAIAYATTSSCIQLLVHKTTCVYINQRVQIYFIHPYCHEFQQATQSFQKFSVACVYILYSMLHEHSLNTFKDEAHSCRCNDTNCNFCKSALTFKCHFNSFH